MYEKHITYEHRKTEWAQQNEEKKNKEMRRVWEIRN